MFLKVLRLKWREYKYRFVPWIMFNLNNRTVRSVSENQSDKIISDKTALRSILKVFRSLDDAQTQVHTDRLRVMEQSLGFAIARHQSALPTGGTGVFVTRGKVPKASLVALYPGTIYDPHNPILIQSLGNPFIFRCIDGTLIDGNDKSLSKYIYRSCSGRDKHGPYETSDCTWLTQYPFNPLAVGQYVNNQSKKFPANVAYQELDLPVDFPFQLLKYIPNVHYTPVSQLVDPTVLRLRRLVILVSIRDIQPGEELFSSYFTVVH